MRLLGIDYGKKNIGIAFSYGGLSQPLRIINGKNWNTAISQIIRIVIENKINKIIIGIPLDNKGIKTPEAEEIERFGDILGAKSKKKVEFFDEAFSTREALTQSIKLGLSKKARSELDSISAAIILQHYIDSNASN